MIYLWKKIYHSSDMTRKESESIYRIKVLFV